MTNKKIITIKVRNKIADGCGTELVSDNSDYRIHFDLDSDWDGMPAKTARLLFGKGYYDFPFIGNEVDIDVPIPAVRSVTIGLYAGDIKTSTPAFFKCKPSVKSSQSEPTPPPPEDVYNKLVDMIEAMNDPVPRMPVIDADMKEDTPEDRVYNEELHTALKDRDRAYAEAPAKDGGGVNTMFYLSANADKLYNPIGYKSLEAMRDALGWSGVNIVEGEHYVTKTVDGVTSYHPRLFSIVTRTPTGGIRVEGTPKDSTDAVPYGHFKKYTFESTAVKPYQVVLKGSTGALYSTPTDINTKKGSFARRLGY